jgi:hypothetical protein
MDSPKYYFQSCLLILFNCLENCNTSGKIFISMKHTLNYEFRVCHSVLMKIQVMWDVTACEMVVSCRRFGLEYCIHFQEKAVQEECFILKNLAPYSSEI